MLIPESRFTPEALAEQVTLILSNPDGAARMARSATELGLPQSAHQLADLAERLAGPPTA